MTNLSAFDGKIYTHGNFLQRNADGRAFRHSLKIIPYDRPSSDQRVIRPCGIRGTGGRQTDGVASGHGQKVLPVQPVCGFSAAEYGADIAGIQNGADVVRHGGADGGIGGACDFTCGAGVPQRDMIGKQKRLFFVNGTGQTAAAYSGKGFPETIARMTVIEIVCTGSDRRKGAENQNAAGGVIDRRKRMDVCIRHIVDRNDLLVSIMQLLYHRLRKESSVFCKSAFFHISGS